MTRSTDIVAISLVAIVFIETAVGASAVTTGPSIIKSTLQIDPSVKGEQPHPLFAAQYWKQQRDITTDLSKSTSYDSNDYDFEHYSDPASQSPHKLSAAQQEHILDDIRRHNQQQHKWWTAASTEAATESSSLTTRPKVDPAVDQLQQLLQINGVAAADDVDTVTTADNQDDDRHGKQRSVGWQPQLQPQPPQLHNNNRQQQLSLSSYVSSPPSNTVLMHSHHLQQQNVQQQPQQQQYFPTATTSVVPTMQYNQQQYVTTPVSTTTMNGQQQYILSQQPQPSSVFGGDTVDPDIEHQIRQQLTAVAGGGNFTMLNSLNDIGSVTSLSGNNRPLRPTQPTNIAGSASNDNLQYVYIGAGSSQYRETSPASTANNVGGNRNTIVNTVVRQKPSTPTTSQPTTTIQQQQSWSASDQQQLEQLARQVLPPGVAQYEIIRAGGTDGSGSKVDGDTSSASDGAAQQQLPATIGKKKPVTFVILEERPDGTVRVRGIEKKQHGVAPVSGGDATSTESGSSVAAADDKQLQQLVDKLNRGELRLPTGTVSPAAASSNVVRPLDSAASASTTATAPLSNKHRDQQSFTSYFPTVTPKITTAATTAPQRHHHQNFFLPTAVPTTGTAITTTTANSMAGQQQQHQHRYHQQHQNHQQKQKQQQYYSKPTNSTLYQNNNNNNNKTTTAKENSFSSALRRRGYYAMAKYMRQAGVDAVLEETGPFTVFVPTDKAFRALLVQLGGPDRAENKFRENPRLLIGLLLHHVVPGAFKVADLMAGDEMTGVSLAGTQLRANLYARQLYDNRWNDIEVLTVNGARILDDIVPAADDGVSVDDVNSGSGHQQRRDIVLSPSGTGGANQQIMAIGHAIDRVLFPLPVGDMLATMRADRQHRYNVFLRAVDEYCSSSVRTLLTGSRTITVFAPVDDAFRTKRGSGNYSTSGSIMDAVLRDDEGKSNRRKRSIADRFVLSHVVLAGPGDPPMYTAGLRFYQVRDTAYKLSVGESANSGTSNSYIDDDGGNDGGEIDGVSDDGNGNLTLPSDDDSETPRFYQLTVYKDSGKIRLNGGAAQILVRNVPVTNGVLHGIDAPLV